MKLNVSEIKRIFQEARKDLHYPPITKFEFANISNAEIDFSARKYKILLGKNLVRKLSKRALLGAFHHELNHWARHPYDAKTIILEYHWLSESKNKKMIRNLYDDAVVNLDLVINKGLDDVAKVYRELPAVSKADNLLRAFFKEATGIDFGETKLNETLKQKLRELCEIDFLDTSKVRIKTNIRRFAKIIDDLVDFAIPFSIFGIEDFAPEEIRKAMRDIAREVDPEEYREIAEEVLKELNIEERERKKGTGISRGEKLVKELEKPDISWYKTRAQRYAIYIKALSKKGSLYPDEIKSFELDDSVDIYSPIDSYGKVLPGLAKKYELEEFEGHGGVSIPDAIVIIDSSGSMRNPDKEISHAVLGAFAIARNYLEHGSKVGVINFSNKNIELEPTRNRDRVYEILKIYQGGGTTLHLDDFEQYMRRIDGNEKDCILITDVGLDNISEVIDYFSKLKNRLTIIWIKSDVKDYEIFQKSYKLLKEGLPFVTFVEVEDERDIPRIAVGKSFGEVYAR
jgi:hypothetical protein